MMMMMGSKIERDSLFTVDELCSFTRGTVLIRGERKIETVGIDSREITGGELFIPLTGSRVDGHQFLEEALRRGAAAVLSSAEQWRHYRDEIVRLAHERGASVVQVVNTLRALQDMGREHMKKRPGTLRIGITGSNGKTTTKEILGSILEGVDKTSISLGNLNSEIGLPLSTFQVAEDDRYAVFEMGMNHTGEMDVLADIVLPDLALITNIGSAHIGLLGSMEAIAREKKKIFKNFNGRQNAFLYEEERFFPFLAEGLRGKMHTYGPRSTKGYEGSESMGLDGTAIHWEGLQIRFPLFGFHNLLNALAAISLSVELGIESSKIKSGLEKVKPLFGRSQIHRGEVSIIQDCYNANPDSFRKVFQFLKGLKWPGRKIAVLGSMLELGSESESLHRQIGLEAGRSGLDMIYFFGPEMESALAALASEGFEGFMTWAEDIDVLSSRLYSRLQPGDLVLLKGSRGTALERLLPSLKESPGQVGG